MQAGQLKTKIELRREVKTPDECGGYAVEYQKYAEPWANMKPVNSRNRDEHEQVLPERTYQITVRFRRDVAPNDRIIVGTREFMQYAPPVNVGEANAWLQMSCVEVVADG